MAFLNPLFLLGGLAVAVPVLLHLIKRANARKIEFPTLMFLRKIDKKTIRYQKLRHLLLLLLRILAFLFLVFAFMRPYRKEAAVSSAVVGRTTSAHIIALDNSMSMSYQDRWDWAKTAAADIVRQSNEGDRFAILEFSDRTVIRTPLTNDESTALNGIENAPEPGDRPTRYDQALRAAEEIAQEAGSAIRVIHLISDFQKNGWTDEESEFRLGAGIELQPVDVGSDEFSNLAIRNVHTVESDESGAPDFRIKATLVEFGGRDRENVLVGLTVDSRATTEKTVRVAKEGAEEIEFRIPGLSSGEHSVVLQIDDSYLERDNRFYMTFEVRGKTPVLVVEKPEARGRRSSSFFLASALNVDRLSPYQVKSVSPQNLDVTGNLLIWNNLPVGTPALQKRLEDFVKGGGGFIVVLADAMKASEFNRSFGTWLPVRMEEASSGKRRLGVSPTDDFVLMTDIRMDHPIFQPFGKPHSGTFSSARFYSHSRIFTDPGAEVLARFDNGDPALISIGMEKGRVLVFTSSADDTGNDLPLKAVYAPFWQQMLRYLESFEEQRNWLEIGDIIDPRKVLSDKAFRRGEDAPDPDAAIALLDPMKQRLEISSNTGSTVTEKAGFYDIRTMGRNATVAVNTLPTESDLTHRSAEEMAAAWVSSQPAEFSEDEVPTAEELDKSQRFWIFLFWAALILFLSELFLSNSALKTEGDENPNVTILNA